MKTVKKPSSFRQTFAIDNRAFDLPSQQLGVKPYRPLGTSGLCSANCSNLHTAFAHVERIEAINPRFSEFPFIDESIMPFFHQYLNDNSLFLVSSILLESQRSSRLPTKQKRNGKQSECIGNFSQTPQDKW